jgi:CheY-like chemotaxis protein
MVPPPSSTEPTETSPGAHRALIFDCSDKVAPLLAATAGEAGFTFEIAHTAAEARTLLEGSLFDAEFYCLDESPQDVLAIAHVSTEVHHVPARFRAFLASEATTRSRVEAAQLGIDLFESLPVDALHFLLHVACRLAVRDLPAENILVIDDDPLTRAWLGQVFKRNGIEPFLLDDPSDFWAALEARNPPLILLDIELPGLNGLDLCRSLRASQRWRSVPVVVLTSSTGLDVRLEVFAAGADDYVSKPVLPEELLARVAFRLRREVERRRFEELGLGG